MKDFEAEILNQVYGNSSDLEARILDSLSRKQPEGSAKHTETNDKLVLDPNRSIWEFDDLVIDKKLEANFSGSSRPNPYNLLVVHGTLEIKEAGHIETAQDLFIRAKHIKTEVKDGLSKPGRINLTGGLPGKNGKPWTKTKAEDGDDGPNIGKPGRKGDDAGTVDHRGQTGRPGGTGDHGQVGTHGEDGKYGTDGEDCNRLLIVADTFDPNAWIVVQGEGGHGGRGSNGQSGGDGGTGNTGGIGGQGGHASLTRGAGDGGAGGQGGDAGRGGDAGFGGDAGAGGDGAKVTTYYLQRFRGPLLFEPILDGGDAGVPGKKGNPGAPGFPGKGGRGGPGGNGSALRSPGERGKPDPGPAGNKNKGGATAQDGLEKSRGQTFSAVGPKFARDTPIWPYAASLTDADWGEILNV